MVEGGIHLGCQTFFFFSSLSYSASFVAISFAFVFLKERGEAETEGPSSFPTAFHRFACVVESVATSHDERHDGPNKEESTMDSMDSRIVGF